MTRFVEIRSFNLKPGARDEFHRLFVERSLALHKSWDMDVLRHGASPHDEDSYFVMRSFPSLEDHEKIEDAYYGSDEWKLGPREAILALVENYTTVVIEMEESTISALKQ